MPRLQEHRTSCPAAAARAGPAATDLRSQLGFTLEAGSLRPGTGQHWTRRTQATQAVHTAVLFPRHAQSKVKKQAQCARSGCTRDCDSVSALGGYPEGNKHLREATSPPTANMISAPEREQQMAKACALAAAGICGCASQVRQDVVLYIDEDQSTYCPTCLCPRTPAPDLT